MMRKPGVGMVKYPVNINLAKVLVFIRNNHFSTLSFRRVVAGSRYHVQYRPRATAKPSHLFSGRYMAIERTLSIIKPDAVAKNVIGQIVARFEQAGLKVAAARLQQLSREEAQRFYAVHKERPFYNDLVDFMVSGPVFVQVLEGENAIRKNRDLMGATDPKKADAGTIRADFADSIDANAVHGSDAADTAAVEIAFFFPESNIHSR
jgi:nucleoside-diphosphate kinase